MGVSADTATWGSCAERSAMAARITAGEYRIAAIVAVWQKPASGKLLTAPGQTDAREVTRVGTTYSYIEDVTGDKYIVMPDGSVTHIAHHTAAKK